MREVLLPKLLRSPLLHHHIRPDRIIYSPLTKDENTTLILKLTSPKSKGKVNSEACLAVSLGGNTAEWGSHIP